MPVKRAYQQESLIENFIDTPPSMAIKKPFMNGYFWENQANSSLRLRHVIRLILLHFKAIFVFRFSTSPLNPIPLLCKHSELLFLSPCLKSEKWRVRDIYAKKGWPFMERIAVSQLSIGRKLNVPMYSRTGKLLLAEDKAMTRNMKRSLESAALEFVYLGQWNPETVARYESAWTDYRSLSACLLRRLEGDIEAELAEMQHAVEPSGEPLRKSMLASPRRHRTQAEITQVQRDYEAAMNETTLAVKGGLDDDELPGAAQRVALTVMKRVKTDLDLLLLLMQRKKKSAYFEQHALNTVILSMSIAAAMGFSEDQITQLGMGALFKDIGMRQAPQELVNAPRKISPSEHVDIQKHTIAGLNALQQVRGLPNFARFILYQHHERMDGRGYPKGRKKAVIHTFSRIVAVADAYDSLTSPRPWRPAYHPYRAMEQLIRGSESIYDKDSLRGLLEYLSLFPVGSLMHLDSGDVVRVIANNPGHFHHPVIMVLKTHNGSGLEHQQIIDLSEERTHSLKSPCEDPNIDPATLDIGTAYPPNPQLADTP